MSWRLFVPVGVLVVALLWVYGQKVLTDVRVSQERYVQAGALFLAWINSEEEVEFKDCRKVRDEDREQFEKLRAGDIVLVTREGDMIFPMSSYVRQLHRSRDRTKLETMLRRVNLSIYSLPTRSCSKWSEILSTYKQKREAPSESLRHEL